MYEQKKKKKNNNSAYFSLFIFEWVVLDKNVKKEKNKVNVLLKQCVGFNFNFNWSFHRVLFEMIWCNNTPNRCVAE